MSNALAKIPPELMERLEECAAHAQGMGPNELIIPDRQTYALLGELLDTVPGWQTHRRVGPIWVDLKNGTLVQGRIPKAKR